MRFVAGRGTVAELLTRSAAVAEMLPDGAPGLSCWQGAPQWQRYCRRGRRGRPWEAGTATSSGKASNLPEGMHHREDAAGRDAAAKSHREASKERAPAASRERAPRAASEQKRERQSPLS